MRRTSTAALSLAMIGVLGAATLTAEADASEHDAAQLTVRKEVREEKHLFEPPDESFGFELTGNSTVRSVDLKAGESHTWFDLPAGDYTLTETLTQDQQDDGWQITFVECAEAGVSSDVVTLALDAGDDETCVFENFREVEDENGEINVTKATSEPTDQQFEFVLSDVGSALVGSRDTHTWDSVPPDTYDLTETVPAGWTLDWASCGFTTISPLDDGAQLFLRGGERISCTFHNTSPGEEPAPVDPTVVVTPELGPIGTEFTVSGSDFSPESIATVFLERTENGMSFPIETVATGARGELSHTLPTTLEPAGYETWAVDDETSEVSNIVSFEVTAPAVVIEPLSGPAGTTFTSRGTGFSANSTVTSHLRKPSGQEFEPLQLDTDAHGTFSHPIDSTSFTPGSYTQWVEDDLTEAESEPIDFVVEPRGDPPPRGPFDPPPPPPAGVIADTFSYPFGSGDCTEHAASEYVVKFDPLDVERDYPNHTGEDWNRGWGDTDFGDLVCAVASGTVVDAASFPRWGNIVLVHHQLPDGSEVWSQYAHLSEMAVAKGDVVLRGQLVGQIGRQFPNGRCQADGRNCAHLHLEIRREEVPADHWPGDPDVIRAQYFDPSDHRVDTNPWPGFIEAHSKSR